MLRLPLSWSFRVTNGTLANAESLQSMTFSDNPIFSVDTAPFTTLPLLNRTMLDESMRNTPIACVLTHQPESNITGITCFGCSWDNGYGPTVFHTGVGRHYCDNSVDVAEYNSSQRAPDGADGPRT